MRLFARILASLPRPKMLLSPFMLRVALAALAVTALLPPRGLGVPTCGLLIVTHRPCPGCGMTRALTAMSRLDVDGAVDLHPFAPALWIFLVVCGTAAVASPWRRLLFTFVDRHERAVHACLWLGVAVYLTHGVARFVAAQP